MNAGASKRRGSPRSPVEALRPAADRVRAWFFSDSWGSAVAWLALALLMAAALAWFFILSPYGAPAAPAYAEF